MMRLRCAEMMVVITLLVGVATAPVRAGVIRDIGYGLAYAGFNIDGRRNHLSGGVDFLLNRNLVGNTLDFGALDLTLAGPVSLSASFGGRYLQQFDISLRTAMDANATAFPLSYALNSDVGNQSVQASGTLFVDAGFSMNELGFYEVELTYSSRQDVERDGAFADRNDQYDFDLGPLTVSGNVFTDVLALVTAPLFEGTGRVNPFASFSGRAKLDELLNATGDKALYDLSTAGLFAPFNSGAIAGWNDETGQLAHANARAHTPSFGATVPEPTVLVLMLLGAPALLRRPLRRRFTSY